MAIKKSELYSSLWKSCDQLRAAGGMDASQYKDYVLIVLFVKYVTDKSKFDSNSLVIVPQGGSFDDMIKVKGKKNIGEEMNKIINKLAQANDLKGVIDVIDFNDEAKLGKPVEMINLLSGLIETFQNKSLDFGNNQAGGDDLLGDAYEYLMKNFATESGKSKGQFYTPAEVSRIMAKVIGIKDAKSQEQTIYDPTCGSGSLLLKAADEANVKVSIYGQEKDQATASLAKMNMILHNNETAIIWQGNTLSSPNSEWIENDGSLKRFDFVVANPPFSNKEWLIGVDAINDKWKRFDGFGIPPLKNGDYAFLLHLIKSMKSTAKGAIILPHGVLFRGNAEAEIRANIIKRGYIKGIIGLPANLFYGTGIPACIIVLDKENAQSRKGIFMIDANKGFVKDGNKNRLRSQDIQKIVDTFTNQLEIEKFSRLVRLEEIEKNEYNLNIPRYIDTQEPEDLQNIEAHLKGGIPVEDIEDLSKYWDVYPTLRKQLFTDGISKGFLKVNIPHDEIKRTIFSNTEFITFSDNVKKTFANWKHKHEAYLKSLDIKVHPKKLIQELSESILAQFSNIKLIDKYDIHQHLMDYWQEVMQDDVYVITQDGWKLNITLDKKNEWYCDLLPKELVINKYFNTEKTAIEDLEESKDEITRQLDEMREENSGEGQVFFEVEKVSKKAMKEIKQQEWDEEDKIIIINYEKLLLLEGGFAKRIRVAKSDLDKTLLNKLKSLSVDEIKTLIVDNKWMKTLESSVNSEMDRISQKLMQRIKELVERYAEDLPSIEKEVEMLSAKADQHWIKMGFKI